MVCRLAGGMGRVGVAEAFGDAIVLGWVSR